MISLARLREASLSFILPLMIASAILNQQIDSPLLLGAGQLASLGGSVAAVVIALASFPGRWWSQLLAWTVVFFRAARLLAPDSDILLQLYVASTAALYCLAGSVAIIERPRQMASQLYWACVVGLPLMLLQVLGAGEWTQTLRTDLHDAGWNIRTQYPTLFQGPYEVVLNVIQSRPAGLFPSNNLLSFGLVFALAMHYGMPERRRQYSRDLLLLAVTVLAMAKIAALALAMVFLWLFVAGGRAKRRRALAGIAMTATLVVAYAYCFPGLFAYNTDWEKTVLNFSIRWNDLLYATGSRELQDEAIANLVGLPTTVVIEDESQRQSGYAVILGWWPWLVATALVMLPVYWKGIRLVRRERPAYFLLVTSVLIGAVLVPLITSFLGAVLFWYLAAVAALPVLLALSPDHRRKLTGAPLAPGPPVR